jgi:Flagellar hook-basal body protein
MINLIGGVPGIVTEVASAAAQATGIGGAVTGGRATQSSFADVLQSMGTQVVDNLRQAEKQSFMAVMGEADTREVVDALMTAEQSLQTAIAVRDKLVTAYLDITRMQI